MSEEKIEVIEPEEVKTPEIKTPLQAFALIATGFMFFYENYKKTTILIIIVIIAVSLIIYNNISVVKTINDLFSKL